MASPHVRCKGSPGLAPDTAEIGPSERPSATQVDAQPPVSRVTSMPRAGTQGGRTYKTLPSRLDRRDIARLSAADAAPAGPPPLPPPAGGVIELERTVTAAGNISLGDHVLGAGLPLAGQRVTLRLEGPVAHVLASGVLVRTLACPVPDHARPKLRGARTGTTTTPQLPDGLTVLRRISVRGTIMVGGQRIQVGLPHAGKTAEVTIEPDAFTVHVAPDITGIAARSSSREIRRHKASHYPARPPS